MSSPKGPDAVLIRSELPTALNADGEVFQRQTNSYGGGRKECGRSNIFSTALHINGELWRGSYLRLVRFILLQPGVRYRYRTVRYRTYGRTFWEGATNSEREQE